MKIKKFITICSAALILSIGTTGCEVSLPYGGEDPTVGEKDNKTVYIWTDEDTGVQYIIYREKTMNAGFGGITPRLNADGSLYCVEPTDQDNVSP
ncbi:MAG: DUF6440 family protein [Lachnospiraceae bacterium]|nr:DUF6440 family protein [Lachnospiraceae bacterium]